MTYVAPEGGGARGVDEGGRPGCGHTGDGRSSLQVSIGDYRVAQAPAGHGEGLGEAHDVKSDTYRESIAMFAGAWGESPLKG